MHKTKYPFCLFTIKEDGARVIREVTNSCNYSCSYCIFSSKRGNTQYDVSTERMKETLGELRKNNVKYLKVTGGEPFVRQDLIEILQYASDIGLEIDVSTNASFLTEEKIVALKKMNISYVHVSLDGFDIHTQEYVRGKATFEPTIKGIKKLIEHNMHVRIGTVLYSKNEHHIEEIISYVKSLGVKHIIFSYMEAVGKLRGDEASDLLATTDQDTMTHILEGLQKKYSDSIRIDFSFVEEASHESGACNTCPGGKEFMFLDHKGQLSACTWIAEYFPQFISKDTLHTTSFSKLLNGSEMQAYYAFIEKLKRYGIIGCPKKNLDTVKEIIAIDTFLAKKERDILLQKKFGKMSALYSFTTENIGGYMSHFHCLDKNILTIGGSGDHIFNAYYKGAMFVTGLDKNIFAKYYADLKRHALSRLSYQDFLQFFMYTGNKDMLSYNVYISIRPLLTLSSKYFRDSVYNLFANDGYELRKSPFFNTTYDNAESKIANNIYLQNEHSYYKTQDIIRQKSFSRITDSIETHKPQQTYDIILLSNISDYCHLMYGGANYLQTYVDSIVKKLQDCVSEGGIIQCAYIYNFHTSQYLSTYRNDIDNPDMRDTVFPSTSYKTITFNSALTQENTTDAIIYSIKNT